MVGADGTARVLVTNCLGVSRKIKEGEVVGSAGLVKVVEAVDDQKTCPLVELEDGEAPNSDPDTTTLHLDPDAATPNLDPDSATLTWDPDATMSLGNSVSCVKTVASDQSGGERDEARKQALQQRVGSEFDLSILNHEKQDLLQMLGECHGAFSLEEGETDLVQMTINTGHAHPKKQPVRRVPFTVRQEVARQLRDMQRQGVIQPSTSPWASPMVLVRKKDGDLRLCVDYHHLNSVTKTDTFPIPRIDDLLDQLGKSRYFTTLNLAAGY